MKKLTTINSTLEAGCPLCLFNKPSQLMKPTLKKMMLGPKKETESEYLNLFAKLAFGTGHILNDLVNGVWMNYLLIYLLKVVQMDSVSAGLVMLR